LSSNGLENAVVPAAKILAAFQTAGRQTATGARTGSLGSGGQDGGIGHHGKKRGNVCATP